MHTTTHTLLRLIELAPLCLRSAWLNAEVDLWPHQCQVLLPGVRSVQPAARALRAALRGWRLPPELMTVVPACLEQIEWVLVEEAMLHAVAVKAVCRSARVADLRLRRVAQQYLDALIECGLTVLDDLWFWSVMQQGAEQQRSGGVPYLRLLEADATDAGQDGAQQE